MKSALSVLKLFLDEVGVPSSVETLEQRKLVQKAVYLGQLTGVNLGYRFNWYRLGPYSPALTQDYFALARELSRGETEHEGLVLVDAARERLSKILPAFQPPEEVSLPQADWLELLASIHYLRNQARYSPEKTQKTLEEKKPHVSPFEEIGSKVLLERGLLAA